MATIVEYKNGEPVMKEIREYLNYSNSGQRITITNKTIKIETAITSIEIDIDDEDQYQIVEYNPSICKIIFRTDNLSTPGQMCARYYDHFRVVIGCDDKLWYCEGFITNKRDQSPAIGILGTQFRRSTSCEEPIC